MPYDATQPAEFDGVEFRHGKQTLVIPPLNLRRVKMVKTHLDGVGDTSMTARERLVTHYVPIIHSALQMNYPAITIEDVEEIANMRNCRRLFYAALGTDEQEALAGALAADRLVGEAAPKPETPLAGPRSTGATSTDA